MQVFRDFWQRGKCYLDGPESSLEYWKQEREKSQWETVLVRLKPQYKNKQEIIQPHTSRQETTQLFPSTWHSTFPEPLWLAKITQNVCWVITEWALEWKKLKSQSKCHISIWLVAMCNPDITCRCTHARKPLSPNTHFTSRGISFLKLCCLCATLPLSLCQFGVFQLQLDLAVTWDNDLATEMILSAATGRVTDNPLYLMELIGVTPVTW